jgi:UDP-glucose 4-epimerase
MEPGSAPVHGTPAAGPVGGLAGALPGCFESTTVTGGLGFIGSHLVRRLAGAGVRTTVVDSREPAAKVPGVRYVVADLRSPEQAVRALSGATLVFHLAGTLDAPGSLRDPTADFASNAVTTVNVLDAARLAGVQGFVFPSSALVYGAPADIPVGEDAPLRPTFPYAESKIACERLITAFGKAHGIPCAIARTFVTYGTGEPPSARAEVSQYLRALRSGSCPAILGNPDAKTRDFVHVCDVVEALLLLARRAVTGIVNVGTGEETSLRELVVLLSTALGRPVPHLAWSPSPEDEYRLVADISRLRVLGFRPSVSLPDGVAALCRATAPAKDAVAG